jgi:hypothetical protein
MVEPRQRLYEHIAALVAELIATGSEHVQGVLEVEIHVTK